MIRDDVSRYVDELDILYYPKFKAFYFKVTRTKNVFGISSVASLTDDSGKWNDMIMRQPRQTFHLMAGNSWNPFTLRTGFLYKKRELQDVDATAERITLAFQKNSRCLFDALEGRYNGRLVTVTDMKPIRPALA
ncbi:MAG: hypothetical protein MnENMB40S_24480 [Rhizobiaceae bacterium MnEN-MB40S]|nr:MAG: hypothetical protein MnENMB40S_24480 [Rhizobiaceae bacterium MnEN-MB40S]